MQLWNATTATKGPDFVNREFDQKVKILVSGKKKWKHVPDKTLDPISRD